MFKLQPLCLTVHGYVSVGIWKWDTPEILTSDMKQKWIATVCYLLLNYSWHTDRMWFGPIFSVLLTTKASQLLSDSFPFFFFFSPLLTHPNVWSSGINQTILSKFFFFFGLRKTQIFKLNSLWGCLPFFLLALIIFKRHRALEM